MLETETGGEHIMTGRPVPIGPARQGRLMKGNSMTRIPPFSSPLLLGFGEIERRLERASKGTSDGYPPYNIERFPRQEGRGERLRITLALAGFSREELEVSVEENQLVIRGRQADPNERCYLHRGIAARQFQRAFVLADRLEVSAATLENGLLSIDLEQPEPERAVRRIEIGGA